MHHQLTPTPGSLKLAGITLARRAQNGTFTLCEDMLPILLYAAYGKAVTPQAMRHIKRGCELMKEVKDSDWDDHTPHSTNDIPVLARVNMYFALAGLNPLNGFNVNVRKLVKAESLLVNAIPVNDLIKILEKDSGDDSDDEEDDDESDDEDSGDSSDEDNSNEDFDEKHPRWPAGSPDSTGGEFRPRDDGADSSGSSTVSSSSNAASPDNFSPSNIDDEFRQAFQETFNTPSDGAQNSGQQEQPSDDSNDRVDPAYPIEDTIALLGGGEVIQGVRGALAATEAEAAEIASIISKANQTVGNDGIVASSQSIAEAAADQFVGDDAAPMVDRNTKVYVGQRSADGLRQARYTSASSNDPYINLENESTGGNLHVRWNND